MDTHREEAMGRWRRRGSDVAMNHQPEPPQKLEAEREESPQGELPRRERGPCRRPDFRLSVSRL